MAYLLISYDDYYPNGGFNDIVGAFDSEDEARTAFTGGKDNAEIVKIEDTNVILVRRGHVHPDRGIVWLPTVNVQKVYVPLPVVNSN